MLGNISLGRYYPGTSLLHRLDPRSKILASILVMVMIFISQSIWSILALFTATFALIIVSRVPFRTVISGLKPMLFILIFAFVLNMFTVQGDPWLRIGPLTVSDQGVYTALRMASRLALLILNTTLFLTLTTTPIHVADAIENLLGPLRRFGFPAHEMAMMMSIALRFVPTLLEETDKIMKAQSSRGADYDTGGLIAKARGLVSVLIPLFVSAFRRAEDLAVAMEARCYRGGEGRTRLRQMRYERLDLLFAAGILVFAAVLITLRLLT
ncbi:MAG: energy-coupling factor transporter transmembrane component T [Eubacteriales bacterium]|nr:energy-coupling factor transporter transmembrane component T [Eubacteriales bacterium]MDD3866092.1 energy-coupling factor transporter transmembrane component T [Eubacteriales bacterium]MDD4461097.1 energy-coupling factor transporter transmembrane component T [Eubacteriales bacterium]